MEIRLSLGKFKWNSSSRYYPFPILPKGPEVSVPFVWITCARLHVERNGQIYWYFVTDTTQSHSRFRAKKITLHVPYDRKIVIESSIKMVSAQCLLLFLLHTYMCVYTLIIWLPFQPTTEPKVDNIRMAGYMEKLPVKSNQKKVHAVMKNPAMSIVHWSSSPVPCLIAHLCEGCLHQERCLCFDDRNFILTT